MYNIEHGEQIMGEIIEGSPAVVLRTLGDCADGSVTFISGNIDRLGYEKALFMSGEYKWPDLVCEDDRAHILETMDKNAQGGTDSYYLIYRLNNSPRCTAWVCDFVITERDDKGAICHIDHIFADYTPIKRGQEKIEDHMRQQEVLNDILVSLHDADPSQAFRIILDRVGRYMGISRILIVEDYVDHTRGEAIYEWCGPGVHSLIEAAPLIVNYKEQVPEIEQEIETCGMWSFGSGAVNDHIRGRFGPGSVEATAILTLYTHNQRYGFIRFDECEKARVWSADSLRFLETISKLVSTAVMRRKSAERVETYQMAMERVLNNIPTYVYVSDPVNGAIVFANQAYRRDFPITANPTSEETLHEKIREHINNILEITPVQLRGRTHYFELQLQSTQKWYGVQSSTIPWIDGRPMRLYSCQDISEKKRQEEYIQRIAYMDHLTGLPNRYRCDVELQTALETARRSDEGGYILLIDMDDFKIVNDGYGHDYGDALLIEFGNFLRNSKGAKDSLFRFGGDEFVLLINEASAEDVVRRLEGLIQRTRRPWIVIDKAFYCTVSIGVVAFPDGRMGVKEIMKNADIAMYEAKRTGKNNYVFYTDNMRNDSIERAEMESMMRESISRNFEGMTVYYQPLIELGTGRIIGAEALIRWFTPDGQMIMPGSFISLAEYLGLIIPIGQFVLRRAAALLKRINSAWMPDFLMSVNLSIRQLQQQDIVARIESVIEETGINPNNLVLEVTESLEVTGLQRIQIILGELRKRGIRIAMDDFGTGYSSLSNLNDMPINIIKIDRSFIRNIDSDDYSRSFVTLITAFGHAVGKRICVEGVETKAQLELCALAEADAVQGYYYYKPMPEEELLKILTNDTPCDKL